MDGWMVGWMDGWMVGWMDEWLAGYDVAPRVYTRQFNLDCLNVS